MTPSETTTVAEAMDDLIEWLAVIVRDAGVTGKQAAEITGSFTDLLVNHFGDD